MEDIFSLNEIPDLEPKGQEDKQENNEEINWHKVSPDDMVKFLKAVRPYEDEDGDLKEIPDFVVDGKFNKELFAGVMMFKAPQYFLAGKENAREMIDFLKKLDGSLHHPKLPDTIEYLESQLPYLDEADEISEKTHAELDETLISNDDENIFDTLLKKSEALNKASSSNLLNMQTGVLFISYINKIYDELWKEYLIPKEDDGKNIGSGTKLIAE